MYNTIIISIEDFYREYKECLVYDVVRRITSGRFIDEDDLYEWIVLNAINRYFSEYHRSDIYHLLPLNYDYEDIYYRVGGKIERCIRVKLENVRITKKVTKVRAIVADGTVILAVRTK